MHMCFALSENDMLKISSSFRCKNDISRLHKWKLSSSHVLRSQLLFKHFSDNPTNFYAHINDSLLAKNSKSKHSWDDRTFPQCTVASLTRSWERKTASQTIESGKRRKNCGKKLQDVRHSIMRFLCMSRGRIDDANYRGSHLRQAKASCLTNNNSLDTFRARE